ncbi:alpha/beta-hydrolase [Colletotrichum zoysiae]|uniref:Alpha/beta-hydrolase n=1 Tax=Colletotrichum zoysiae TaxID=1216348 RepID=A0AAD9HKM2_9PEZI|nr:alpha/beta-hydrolase [Colletotrichum zoysiae]
MVHRGFAECANTLAPIILRHIKAALDKIQPQNRDIEIVFTGHSAGGAVASLLFCYFSTFQVLATHQTIPTLSCISFGSPPILTADMDLLISQFSANNIFFGNFLAFVNDGDPIPCMDDTYAKKLASIWHSVGGSRPRRAEDLGAFVPPRLSLNCLGHLVCLIDRNAGSDEEDESLMACYLNHHQLEQRAWANIWAHDMKQYVNWITLLGNNFL